MAARRTTRRQAAVEEGPQFDATRFSSFECFQWLDQKPKAEFVIEKTIHPEVDQEFQLSAQFARLNLEPILRLPGVYYPQLVKEFYANVENKDRKNVLNVVTMVKRRRIELNDGILSGILDVPDVGPRVDQQNRLFASDPKWNRWTILKDLGIHTMDTPKRDKIHRAIKTKHVPIWLQLLVYVSTQCVP